VNSNKVIDSIAIVDGDIINEYKKTNKTPIMQKPISFFITRCVTTAAMMANRISAPASSINTTCIIPEYLNTPITFKIKGKNTIIDAARLSIKEVCFVSLDKTLSENILSSIDKISFKPYPPNI